MKTLLLNQANWDLCLDASGNIAVAEVPYARAQDVASAIKLFEGELWYDTAPGVPYWDRILGQQPPVPLMKAQFVKAALTVPGVVTAVCFLNSIVGREVSGQVQITDHQGAAAVIAVGAALGFPIFFAVTDAGTPGITDGGQSVIVG